MRYEVNVDENNVVRIALDGNFSEPVILQEKKSSSEEWVSAEEALAWGKNLAATMTANKETADAAFEALLASEEPTSAEERASGEESALTPEA